jgi:2-oxoisovalerate dehydrogenase E1 component alpha subunit
MRTENRGKTAKKRFPQSRSGLKGTTVSMPSAKVHKKEGSNGAESASNKKVVNFSSGVSKNTGAELSKDLQLKIFDQMVRSRMLEERLIKMYKTSQGFFWLGGPGEEAFNIPLGMLAKRGEGLDYDYYHLHYRSGAVLLALGGEPVDSLRQMKNTATDPFSGGRNFVNHFSIKKWNVVPMTSTIGTQYATAIGTGLAQKRHGGTGLTIVQGGDAGAAEGEFTSCLLWASRVNNELPILILGMNNQWGISTHRSTQHKETLVDRAKSFKIESAMVNGNDPEESYQAIKHAMDYIRKERKPFFIEASVSRLYGHSSASGANFHPEELDCVVEFEKKLVERKIISQNDAVALRTRYEEEMLALSKQVIKEPMPDPNSIYDYTFKGQKGKYW